MVRPAWESLKRLLSQLPQCVTRRSLPQLHAKILKSRFSDDPFLLTRLAHSYLLSGNPEIGRAHV